MASPEVSESYLRLGEHYYKKSGHYIPGRPQFVVRVGRGDRRMNEGLLNELIATHFGMLSLCQIAYELEAGIITRIISSDHARLPDGERMQEGFIEIPTVAVGINSRTGQAEWWQTRFQLYETQHGTGYEPEIFQKIWQEIAVPILQVRAAGLSGMVREAIDNAIQLVAKCRHAEMGDLTLNSVIATETILNPSNALGDTSERFALFAAALTETTAEKRLEAYKRARNLYRLRSRAVHQSRLHRDRDAAEARKQAFGLFLACLKAITTWVASMLAVGKTCGPEESKQLYMNSIFSPASLPT